MTSTQLTALLPLLGIAGTSIVLMAAVSIRRSNRWTQVITLGGLAVSFGALFAARPASPLQITPLLLIDGPALFFFALIIATAAVVALLAHDYFRRRGCRTEEFSLLLLFATLGSCVLARKSATPHLNPVMTLSEMKFTIPPALTSHATRAMTATRSAVAAANAPNRVGSPPEISPSDAPISREMAEVTVIAV